MQPRFLSTREQRLWLWVLLVQLAIYSTLGPARTIAAGLRQYHLLPIVVIGILLTLVIMASIASIRDKPSWKDIGVVLAVFFVYVMVGVRIESWEERTHLVEYGVMAALIHEAILERKKFKRYKLNPAVIAFIATALLGFIDELLQWFIPERTFDPRDIFFNALAAFMIIVARLAIGKQHGPGWRLWFLWLLACAYGWGTAVELTGLGEISFFHMPENVMKAFWGVVIAGILVSIFQWLLLRGHIKKAFLWLLTPIIGAIVWAIVLFGFDGSFYSEAKWTVEIGVFGLTMSVLQWLILHQTLKSAWWWMAASVLGWALAIPAGQEVGWNGFGAVVGAATGIVLVLLLKIQNDGLQKPTSDSG